MKCSCLAILVAEYHWHSLYSLAEVRHHTLSQLLIVSMANGSLLKRPLFYQPVIVVPMETEIELNHFGNLILIYLDTNTLQDPVAKATLALAQDTNRNTSLRKTTQASNKNCKTKKKKHTLFTSIIYIIIYQY